MEYLLVERVSHPGRSGRRMWRYTWYDLDQGQLWETTVDSTFRNWRRRGWEALSLDPQPWGVYRGLQQTDRITAEGLPVITADSRPDLQQRLTHQQVLEVMALDHWDRERSNEYGRLFA